MIINEILKNSILKLNHISDSATLDCEILLSFVLGKNRSYLKAFPETMINQEQEKQFLALFNRRLQGEPIAYLIGIQSFWKFDLKVNDNVLIPRGDSETLIEAVVDYFKNEKNIKKQVLDLGTGSGALALAIAYEFPHWQVTATDISNKALQVAKENASLLKLGNIEFIQSDWFLNIGNKRFDLIISNPPYIDENDPEVDLFVKKYEPQKALFSKTNGLEDLYKIIEESKKYLNKNGAIFLEHGHRQAQKIREKLLKEEFCHDKTFKDLNKKDRITMAIKK